MLAHRDRRLLDPQAAGLEPAGAWARGGRRVGCQPDEAGFDGVAVVAVVAVSVVSAGSAVPAPVAAPVEKGPCGVCGKVVTSADNGRRLVVGVYMHDLCYKKCPVCKGETPDLTTCTKISTGQHVHNHCDPIKGKCQKCGKDVKQYLHPNRLGNGRGEYWHGECGTAAKNMGICPECKLWVLAKGEWVPKREGDKVVYYHSCCAK